jgi:hypothetical protein
MTGRPSKFTPEIGAAIVKSLAIGATRTDAVGAVGIDYGTFSNWLKQGEEKGSGPFFRFFVACRQAESEARLKYTSVIAKAASEGDWRAALEYLKRRDRPNWGDGVDVTSGGQPLPRLYEKISPDDL